jgi:hypothetical protein
MATRNDYDFEEASSAELEAAVRPFIERFVTADKRERLASLFVPPRPFAWRRGGLHRARWGLRAGSLRGRR